MRIIIVGLLIIGNVSLSGWAQDRSSSVPLILQNLQKTLKIEDWDQQFQEEMRYVQERHPGLLAGGELPTWAHSHPGHKELSHILFWALQEECANDFQCLYRTFPALSTKYCPLYFEDLNGDGMKELICVNDYLTDYGIVLIYNQHNDMITIYQFNLDAKGLSVSIRERDSIRPPVLLVRKEVRRCIQVEHSHQRVTFKRAAEMLLEFTGQEIKILRPYKEYDPVIILDDTDCDDRGW